MNKKIVHDALVLFAFTIVLGLILALVHWITKAPIDASNERTRQAAFRSVFETAEDFEDYEFDSAAANKLLADNGYNDVINEIVVAKDDAGETLGYVISVTAKDGSQGEISFSVGIMSDGTVNGYSITATGETPGLGLKASEPEFSNQFKDTLTSGFYVNDKESGSGDNPVGIDAITGSTITSKAIVHGCNAAILYFNNELGGAENE